MDATFVVPKRGTGRLAVKERKRFGLDATEGKEPLPWRAYKYLAKILFESDEPDHVAAHTFLLLEWNIKSRAEYVVDSNIYLVYFQQDALLFDIGKTKTRQEGTKHILTTHGMSIPIPNTLKFVHL